MCRTRAGGRDAPGRLAGGEQVCARGCEKPGPSFPRACFGEQRARGPTAPPLRRLGRGRVIRLPSGHFNRSQVSSRRGDRMVQRAQLSPPPAPPRHATHALGAALDSWVTACGALVARVGSEGPSREGRPRLQGMGGGLTEDFVVAGSCVTSERGVGGGAAGTGSRRGMWPGDLG